MAKLEIDFSLAGATEDSSPATRIAIRHFKASDVIFGGGGQKTLAHSPGIVILMPRSSRMTFSTANRPIPIPPGVATVLDGDAENVLATVEGFDEERGTLPVIEISAIVNDSSRLKDTLALPTILDRQTSGTLSTIYTDLLCTYQATLPAAHDDVSLHLAAGQIVNLLLNLDDEPSPSHRKVGQHKLLNDLRRYMLENLGCTITTADMAAQLNMSRQHFSAWSKRMLGSTPARYLRNLRLERSMEWLEHSDESIEMIADRLSFTDRYHYSKLFKEKYKHTPIQYRKKVLAANVRDLFSQGEVLFHNQKYADALAICEEGLNDPSFKTDSDRLLILRGSCLAELGRHDEALNAWHAITNPSCVMQTGTLRCKLFFKLGRTTESLAELEGLWTRVEAWQYGDLIQLWIEHVSVLYTSRRAQPLRRHLAFRRKRFRHDRQSQPITLHACRDIGDYMDVLKQCPDLKEACLLSLSRAGEYDLAFKKFGSDVPPRLHARMLLESGRYHEVLALQPEHPVYACRALIELGRLEEAIERFPDRSAAAYMALGRYQELLDQTSGVGIAKVRALCALDRTEEIENLTIKGSYQWHVIQCHLNPQILLEVDFPDTPEFTHSARLLVTLKALLTDKIDDARNHLAKLAGVSSPDLWPERYGSIELLIISAIPALLDDTVDIRKDLEIMCRDFRYFCQQTLYHDAAYLLGEIDEKAYHEQPRQMGLRNRWSFIQALACDLGGQHDKALCQYAKILESPTTRDRNVMSHFCRWRAGS